MDRFACRKGSCVLQLSYADGTPAAHRRIQAQQITQAFGFGCGAFDTVPLAGGDISEAERLSLGERMDKWLELFNYGTLPFYWGRFEPERDHPQTEALMRAALWLQARGVTVKGHTLCWHTVTAPWLTELSNEAIMQAQLERIRRDVTDFKGVIDRWDVINEAVIMPVFDKYDNGITRVCKQLGRVRMVKEVFAAAREANPGALLVMNDFNVSDEYQILIDGCLNAGVPIDVIGIQSHQHQGYWGLTKLQEVLDRFAVFGLPLHFTENTLISGELMPGYIEDLNDWQVSQWPTTPEGEARQARETVEMLDALFAHPLVEAFTIWDHVDGKWLGAPSGVLRADNTEKPVRTALMRRIREDWRTRVTLETDEAGRAELSGFLGSYEIIDMQKHGRAVLTKDTHQPVQVLLEEV